MYSTIKIKNEYRRAVEHIIELVIDINDRFPSNMVEYSLQNIENHIDCMCDCLKCGDLCGFARHYEISSNLISNLESQYGWLKK